MDTKNFINNFLCVGSQNHVLRNSLSTPNGYHSDLTVFVGDKTYKCHKIFFITLCKPFESMINGCDCGSSGVFTYQESVKNTIKFENISIDAFEFVLDLIYLGRCNAKEEMTQEDFLIIISEVYSFSLKYGIESFLCEFNRVVPEIVANSDTSVAVQYLNVITSHPESMKYNPQDPTTSRYIGGDVKVRINNSEPSVLLFDSFCAGSSEFLVDYIFSLRTREACPSMVCHSVDLLLYYISKWFSFQFRHVLCKKEMNSNEEEDELTDMMVFEKILQKKLDCEDSDVQELLPLVKFGRKFIHRDFLKVQDFEGYVFVPFQFFLIFVHSETLTEKEALDFCNFVNSKVFNENMKEPWVPKDESICISKHSLAAIHSSTWKFLQTPQMIYNFKYGHATGSLIRICNWEEKNVSISPSLKKSIRILYPQVEFNADYVYKCYIQRASNSFNYHSISFSIGYMSKMRHSETYCKNILNSYLSNGYPKKEQKFLEGKCFVDLNDSLDNLDFIEYVYIYIKQIDENTQGIALLGKPNLDTIERFQMVPDTWEREELFGQLRTYTTSQNFVTFDQHKLSEMVRVSYQSENCIPLICGMFKAAYKKIGNLCYS